VPDSPEQIVEQIFTVAVVDDAARVVAERLQAAEAAGRWEVGALDQMLRELEEEI
jgi:hypothetical protein